MKLIRVSDELYDQLKGFVVDPFDDTPEIVIGRLATIVNKAKSRWSPLDDPGNVENLEHLEHVGHIESLGEHRVRIHDEPSRDPDDRIVAL